MVKKHLLLAVTALVILGIISVIANITHVNAQSLLPHKIARPVIMKPMTPVCGLRINGMMRCNAHVVTDTTGRPLGTTAPYSTSNGPIQFHTAYNMPCTPGGPVQTACATPSSFGGQTIAIITAYNAPTLENDLNTYSSYFGIPSCTKANGCLTIVNENGGTTLPATNANWALETSLDTQIAHMICQTCKLLVVEANASYFSDLGTAVNTAAQLGATEISNSYGTTEWSSETSYDTYYNHSGIAVTAASGDNGFGAEYPAASQYVVGTGGTTLQINTDNTYASESVWNSAGSGCSKYEPVNTWQKNLTNWNFTNCTTHKAVSDISADADPNTGAAIFDSTTLNGSSGWYQIGGTSLSSPLIASMYALAGGVPANTNAVSLPYANFTSANSHDVTSGNNGNCGTLMCIAGVGYDGPTGLGTPNGDSGFNLLLNPTPSINSGPTATPTITPTPTTESGSVSATPTPTVTPTTIPTATPTQSQGQTLTFGYATIGSALDSIDQNYIDGSRFRMGTTNGTLKSISVYVGNTAGAPYNQYQVALYTDNNGIPGTLLAKSSTGTLMPNSWNTLSVSASLNANTYYWLVYNTNSNNSSLNDLRFTNTGTLIGTYSSRPVPFGTWPTTFSSTRDGYEYSMFATYTTP